MYCTKYVRYILHKARHANNKHIDFRNALLQHHPYISCLRLLSHGHFVHQLEAALFVLDVSYKGFCNSFAILSAFEAWEVTQRPNVP